jgi:hypothetical protein
MVQKGLNGSEKGCNGIVIAYNRDKATYKAID